MQLYLSGYVHKEAALRSSFGLWTLQLLLLLNTVNFMSFLLQDRLLGHHIVFCKRDDLVTERSGDLFESAAFSLCIVSSGATNIAMHS